ncbi:MAG TPA: hypothetical protein VKD71_14860 [Gemmataceae bacterium]|nr:hypothetical protein [Gemmataceae bacterium]
MRRTLVGVIALFLAAVAVAADPPTGYKLEKTIPIKGDGGWDYLTVDSAARRVYVSHATVVEVLDADTGELRGQIPDTAGVYGIAVAADLGRGFTSNGRADTVTAFDLKTLKRLASIKTAKNPDAILYDPSTERVFAFNGNSKRVTVIDATDDNVVARIDLGGKPEGTATDETGHVRVLVFGK